MMVDTKDLVSTTGIADRLCQLVTTVSNWKRRYADFPEPVMRMGPHGRESLYLFSEVQVWYEKRVAAQEARRKERIAKLEEALEKARTMDRRHRLNVEMARLRGMV